MISTKVAEGLPYNRINTAGTKPQRELQSNTL
jgi:hypothetical protein